MRTSGWLWPQREFKAPPLRRPPGGHPGQARLQGNPAGNLPVSHDLPEGNGKQDFPERGGAQGQFRGEIRRYAAEIDVRPVIRFLKDRKRFFFARFVQRFREVFLPVKPESGERVTAAGQGDPAERRIIMMHPVHFSFGKKASVCQFFRIELFHIR